MPVQILERTAETGDKPDMFLFTATEKQWAITTQEAGDPDIKNFLFYCDREEIGCNNIGGDPDIFFFTLTERKSAVTI